MEKLGISWTRSSRIYFITSFGWMDYPYNHCIKGSFGWTEGHDKLIAPKEFVQWLD